MAGWFLRGLASGIRTTRFPHRADATPGVIVGLPLETDFTYARVAAEAAKRCPTGALTARGIVVGVDARRCIHCFRCVRGTVTPMRWGSTVALRGPSAGAALPAGAQPTGGGEVRLGRAFRRSINILVVDAGDCGACLNEVRQLNAPQYNMHRLGFFITPTPRNADLLLVVGQVTDAMRHPLLAAYTAMPEPKLVIAVGTCAVTGALFGESFATAAGVGDLLPVDAEVPGSPPSPLEILAALLALTGRAPARAESPAGGARPAETQS